MSKKRGKTTDGGLKANKKGMQSSSQIQITDYSAKPSSKSATPSTATTSSKAATASFQLGQVVDIQQESRGKWKRGKVVHIRTAVATTSSRKKQQIVLYDVSYEGGQMECEIDADRLRPLKQVESSPFALRPPATADILEFTKMAEAKKVSKQRHTAIDSTHDDARLTTADPSTLLTKRQTFGDDDQSTTEHLFKSEDQVMEHQAEIQRMLDDLFSIHADVHCVQKKALSALLKLLRLAPQITADFFHFKAGETILLHIIRSHQLYSVLQCYGFVLLRKMCHLSADSCAVFVQNGAIPAIAVALRAFPSDPIASGSGALSALGQLSRHAVQVMLEQNVVPLLTASVVNHHDINNHTRQVQFYASEGTSRAKSKVPNECFVVLLEVCDHSGAPVAAAIVDPVDDYLTIRTLVRSIAQVLRQVDAIADLSIVMAKYPSHEGILKYSLAATRELAVASMRQSPSTKVRQTARIILEEEPLKRSKPASPASARKKSKTSKAFSLTTNLPLPSPSRGATKKEPTTREKLLLQTYGFDPSSNAASNVVATARASKSRQGSSPSRKKPSITKQPDAFLNSTTASTELREPMADLLRPHSSSKLLPLAITDPPAVRPATMATTQPIKRDRLDVLVVPASPLAELKSFATELFEAVNDDPLTPLSRISFADKLHRMIEKAETSLDPVYVAAPARTSPAMPPPAHVKPSQPYHPVDTATPVNLQNGIFTPLSQKHPLTVGAKVKCRFNGGARYYAGVITRCSRDNQSFDVDYVDGEQECEVPVDWIRLLETPTPTTVSSLPAKFTKGDVVEARYKGKSKFYPGVITRVTDNSQSYDVLYDDGETESNVNHNLIILVRRNERQDKANSPSGWKVGQKVEARYKRRQKYYKGKVARARSNGTYDVEYDDGERETGVDKDMIRALGDLDERPQFEEGDLVQAQYEGNARFYNGTILRCRLDGSYDIKYDDGDIETFVAAELICKRTPPPIVPYAVDARIEVVKGARSMPGTITKVSNTTGLVTVLYDNGDKEKVPPDSLRPYAKDESFERHQRIEARPPTSHVYAQGLITNCRFNGTYDIEFESGEVATGVAPLLIRSVPWPPHEAEYYPLWHTGDIVEAKVRGQSKYLPGVVARVHIQGQTTALYDVHFESDAIELRVPEDAIHLLHRAETPVFASGDGVTKNGKLAKVCRCHMDGSYDLKYSNGLKEIRVAKAGLVLASVDAETSGATTDLHGDVVSSWFQEPRKQSQTVAAVPRDTEDQTPDEAVPPVRSGPHAIEIEQSTTENLDRQQAKQATAAARESAKYDEVEVADSVDETAMLLTGQVESTLDQATSEPRNHETLENSTKEVGAASDAIAYESSDEVRQDQRMPDAKGTKQDEQFEVSGIDSTKTTEGDITVARQEHNTLYSEKSPVDSGHILNDNCNGSRDVIATSEAKDEVKATDSDGVAGRFENDDGARHIERDAETSATNAEAESKARCADEAKAQTSSGISDDAISSSETLPAMDLNPPEDEALHRLNLKNVDDQRATPNQLATRVEEDPFARALAILSVAGGAVDGIIKAAVQGAVAIAASPQPQLPEEGPSVQDASIEIALAESQPWDCPGTNVVVIPAFEFAEVVSAFPELQLVKSLSASTASLVVHQSIIEGVQRMVSRQDFVPLGGMTPASEDVFEIVQPDTTENDYPNPLSDIVPVIPLLKMPSAYSVSRLLITPAHMNVAVQVVNDVIQRALEAAASSNSTERQCCPFPPSPASSFRATAPRERRSDVPYFVPPLSHKMIVPPLRASTIRPLTPTTIVSQLTRQFVDQAMTNALVAYASLPNLAIFGPPGTSNTSAPTGQPEIVLESVVAREESSMQAYAELELVEMPASPHQPESNRSTSQLTDTIDTSPLHAERPGTSPESTTTPDMVGVLQTPQCASLPGLQVDDTIGSDNEDNEISFEVAMTAKSFVLLCLYNGLVQASNQLQEFTDGSVYMQDEVHFTHDDDIEVTDGCAIESSNRSTMKCPAVGTKSITLLAEQVAAKSMTEGILLQATKRSAIEPESSPSTKDELLETSLNNEDLKNITIYATQINDDTIPTTTTKVVNEIEFDLPHPGLWVKSQHAVCNDQPALVNQDVHLAAPADSSTRNEESNQCTHEATATVQFIVSSVVDKLVKKSESQDEPLSVDIEPLSRQIHGVANDIGLDGIKSILFTQDPDTSFSRENISCSTIDQEDDIPSDWRIAAEYTNEFTPSDANCEINKATPAEPADTPTDKATEVEPAQPSPVDDEGASYGQDEEFDQPEETQATPDAALPTADPPVEEQEFEATPSVEVHPQELAAPSESVESHATVATDVVAAPVDSAVKEDVVADDVQAYANDADEFADKAT
ncbi:hypothetical protein DYB31_005919, partial [Aphanomyces astaci]